MRIALFVTLRSGARYFPLSSVVGGVDPTLRPNSPPIWNSPGLLQAARSTTSTRGGLTGCPLLTAWHVQKSLISLSRVERVALLKLLPPAAATHRLHQVHQQDK
jgi:hypothetical protein